MKKIIDTMNLGEIEDFLHSCDEAPNDEELRVLFAKFNGQYDHDLPTDPFSDSYRLKQLEIYAQLAKKEYSVQNEITKFSLKEAFRKPFPYCHESSELVGNTLQAIGFLINKMQLARGSKILEFGPGWGNTTIELAKMGYQVKAIEIESNFVELIRRRAKREGLENIEILHGDFFTVDSLDESFDAILFFESFHHCSDHLGLLESVSRKLKPSGKVVFAAEPITTDFPIPWGIRMDGESVWAISRNGWLELGFNRNYFSNALRRLEMVVSFYDGQDSPWSKLAIAQRLIEAYFSISIANPKFGTQVGTRIGSKIKGGYRAGFILFGPYISLSAGNYEVSIDVLSESEKDIEVVFDVVSGFGKTEHAKAKRVLTLGNNKLNLRLELEAEVNLLETRLSSSYPTDTLLISEVHFSREY